MNSFKIAVWNANGLSQHSHEIEIFLKNGDIDIMLISETHFTQKSFLRLKGYTIYTTNHPSGTARGGSAIIVKNTIHHSPKSSFQKSYVQATSIEINCLPFPIILSSVYFPPSRNPEENDFKEFFLSLGTRFIACGDYNAKHTAWGSRLITTRGRELYKTIQKNNLSHLSTGEPTYWPSDTSKIPDLIDFCVYKGIHPNHLAIKSCFDLASDHSPFIVTVESNIKISQSKPCLHSPATNWGLFRDIINQSLILNIPLKDGSDIENAVKHFTNVTQNAGWKSTPYKITKTEKNWIHPELKAKIKRRRELRRMWQSTRYPEYKRQLNKITREIKELAINLKQNDLEDWLKSLTATKDSEYSLWKAAKNLKRPKKRISPIKTSNGVWARTDQDKTNIFATHLESVFSPPSLGNPQQKQCFLDFLDAPGQLDFPVRCFTKAQVKRECAKLKKNKAPGYDLITAKVLQELPESGYKYLTQLFNAINRCAYFPLQWKVSEIIMIPKPGKPPEEVTSYRPISLLPIASKVYEKLLLAQLKPIIERENLIPNHQFGFRENHGTIEQVHRVHRVIKSAMERKEYCTTSFLDVTQAFDKVWLTGLLFKLKSNLPYPYYEILKSYLTERHFMVKSNEETSKIHPIGAGVPQGSVLGPVLYTLFTADLPQTERVSIATFADDTVLLASHANPANASELLQSALNVLEIWLKTWNIQVNPTKSVQVTFTTRKGQCPPVSLNNQLLPSAECAKYLGIHLDRRLTWRQHIFTKRKQLGIQLTKMYWLLGKHSKLTLQNKMLIYKAILKPIWLYGIQLWGTAAKSNTAIIQRFQSKTLRAITNAPWYVTNDCLHRDLNIATVTEEIQRFDSNYAARLQLHPNPLATDLLNSPRSSSRLKRFQGNHLVVLR